MFFVERSLQQEKPSKIKRQSVNIDLSIFLFLILAVNPRVSPPVKVKGKERSHQQEKPSEIKSKIKRQSWSNVVNVTHLTEAIGLIVIIVINGIMLNV